MSKLPEEGILTEEQANKRKKAQGVEVAVKDLPLHAQVALLLNRVDQLEKRVDQLSSTTYRHDRELMMIRPIGGGLF